MDRDILLLSLPSSGFLAFGPVGGWSLFPCNPAFNPGFPSRILILSRVPERLSSAANRKWLKSIRWA